MKHIFMNINEAFEANCSEYFFVSSDGKEVMGGDKISFYNNVNNLEFLTFDISNNKILANINPNGSIKSITAYRNYYSTNADSSCWPGVWTYKDYSSFGPYSLSIRVNDDMFELDHIEKYKTELLDNIFPISTVQLEKLQVKIISFAPISENSKKRLSGIVQCVEITNKSNEPIKGMICLPEMFLQKSITRKIGIENELPITHDLDMSFLEEDGYCDKLSFDLKPYEEVYFSCAYFLPNSGFLEEIEEQGVLDWLNQTRTYFRNILGSLSIEENPYIQEFFERAVLQSFGCINMNQSDEVVGSNWGTYPATSQTWMKDMYHSALPFVILEPEFFKECLEWFSITSSRHKSRNFEGGVGHSLSNALTPVIFAGLYYEYTGDKEYFSYNPDLYKKLRNILEEVITLNENNNATLFQSLLISDGDAIGDYHTGSNVCAWVAFNTFSRISKDVFNSTEDALRYEQIAKKIHSDLDEHNIINGPFGAQYIEGMNKDGSIPSMYHEAEETDTTLMPFYGYTDYNDEIYSNYTKFAMSEHNFAYSAVTRGIAWGMHLDSIYVPVSFPSYITRFANCKTKEDLVSNEEDFSEIRKLTDFDGSVWWWPYKEGAAYGQPSRNNVCGKCGWASGVFANLFISEVLGIRYDGINKLFTLKISKLIPSFKWKNFRYGFGYFSLSYKHIDTGVEIQFSNCNDFPVVFKLPNTKTLSCDEIICKDIYTFTGDKGETTINVDSKSTINIFIKHK